MSTVEATRVHQISTATMQQKDLPEKPKVSGKGYRLDGQPQASSDPSALSIIGGKIKETLTFTHWTEDPHFNFIMSLAVILVPLCYLAESTSPTAYGRFGENVDPVMQINPKLGWFLMELPVSAFFVYYFYIKPDNPKNKKFEANKMNSTRQLIAFIYMCQYFYRGFYFPYMMKTSKGAKNFSMMTAIGASSVCTINGYLNAKWLRYHGTHLGDKFSSNWSKDPRFYLGLVLYYLGFLTLIRHDGIIRNLRNTPGPRYRIPTEGLFQYATCPQYFAEHLMWLGWSVLTWGPPAVYMLFVTMMNLPLRSMTTHLWYIEKFGDEYPADRAYMIPFVW